MANISRISTAYILFSGFLAKCMIETEFYKLEISFTESIAAFTILTTMIAGLFLLSSPHRLINNGIFRILENRTNDTRYKTKREICRKDYFLETIDSFWGYLLFTICFFLLSGTYLHSYVHQTGFNQIRIPLVDQQFDVAMIIGLFFFAGIFGVYTIFSWKDFRIRLDCAHFLDYLYLDEYKELNDNFREIRSNLLFSGEQLLRIDDKWKKNYRDWIRIRWDAIYKEFRSEQYRFLDNIRKINEILTRHEGNQSSNTNSFCAEFKERSNEIEKFQEVSTDEKLSSLIQKIWEVKFGKYCSLLILNKEGWRFKINGGLALIPTSNSVRLKEFFNQVNKIWETEDELGEFIALVTKLNFRYSFKSTPTPWWNQDLKTAIKFIVILKDLPETQDVINTILDRFPKEKKIYEIHVVPILNEVRAKTVFLKDLRKKILKTEEELNNLIIGFFQSKIDQQALLDETLLFLESTII